MSTVSQDALFPSLGTTVPIRERFDDSRGRFLNYDAYDQTALATLGNKKHVDIRNFVQDNVLADRPLLSLDSIATTTLDALTVNQIEAPVALRAGEQWVFTGTIGKDSDRNNRWGLHLTCTVGSNQATSVINPPQESIFTTPGVIETVDIDTGFSDTDYITVALPELCRYPAEVKVEKTNHR